MPTTSNFGWTTPADTDLVKDGAAAIRTLGNGIDTSFLDLKGGTTGQILAKNSATDLDFVWVANDQGDITAVTAGTGISGGGTSGAVTITNSMATEITASGDIIVGTGSGTFDNLPIGSTGQVLTADTTVSPYKVKWASAGAGFVGAQLTKTAQSVATGDYYAVTWDSEAFDTDSFHNNSTNNSRVTIPSGKSGYYRFSGIMTFASNSTGSRLVRIHKNGSNIVWVGWLAGLAGGNETGVVFCHTLNATAGDYFELFVKQESGSSLNVTASASWDVQYLGA